jgi:hypothetical protein
MTTTTGTLRTQISSAFREAGIESRLRWLSQGMATEI